MSKEQRLHRMAGKEDGEFSFREFIEETEDLVTRVAPSGVILYISSSSQKYYGKNPQECIGRNAFDFVHPEDREKTRKSFSKWLESGDSSFTFVNRQIHTDGTFRHVLWTISAIKDENGAINWFNSIARDITPQKQAELELQKIRKELELRVEERTKALKLAAEVFRHSLEGITITDHNNTIIDINEAFSTITGYSKEEAIGQNPNILKSDRHNDAFYRGMWKALLKNGVWKGEIWNRRKNGEVYPEWLSISKVTSEKGDVTNYVAVFHDISEFKATQSELSHQAYHDALTGLPNRTLLLDRLRKAVNAAKRDDGSLALLFVDLDNFKHVNDSLGHVVGDKVLQDAALRIARLVRQSDTVSRFGGDEFVILVTEVKEKHDTVLLAKRIMDSLADPFKVNSRSFMITPSIGIAFFPEDGITSESLIKHADLAMSEAKKMGRNTYHLFTPRLSEAVHRRIQMENDLRRAVMNREFTVFYQPKVRLSDGKITGMEALVRWQKPDGSLVPPIDFIPLSEKTGLIIPIGEQVLEIACMETVELNQQFGINLKLAVNLSLRQFKSEKLIRTLDGIMSMAQFPSEDLELEITESTVMSDVEFTTNVMNEMCKRGITFSIDDFGTGYSSLTHIKHLPLHTLKIDKSFVDGLPNNETDWKITQVIISLAKSFGLATVAEGVETVDQYVFLKNLGCDTIQGYLYSPPVPKEEFAKLLAKSI